MSEALLEGKYYYLARVIKSGYRRDTGSPATDPNNPTGWNTGQWIDVQILRASAQRPRGSPPYEEGEIVQGFWSCGGDDGIVGKPTAGDVVGYFEAPYARVWEKVSTLVPKMPEADADAIEAELPETQSGFSKIYAWLLTLLSFLGVIVGLLGIFTPIRLLHGPSWASPAFVVVSAVALWSAAGLRKNEEWGLTWFTVAAFLFGLILFKSGYSTYISLVPALLILPILVTRVWEESEVISDTSLARMLKYALEQEKLSAAKGLKAFEKFELVNVETNQAVFFAGLVGPPVAFVLASWVDSWLPRYNVAVAFVIIFVLGTVPMAYASYWRNVRWRPRVAFRLRGGTRAAGFALGIVFGALILAVMDVFQAFWIAVISAVVMVLLFLPYHLFQYLTGHASSVTWWFPSGMPSSYQAVIIAVVVVVVTVVHFSDARLFPISAKRFFCELRIGLTRNADKLLSYVANNIFSALVLGMAVRYDLLYADWRVGIVAYMITGALLGYDLSRAEINPFLSAVAGLGRIRCLLKQKKTIDADFFVYLLRDGFMEQPEPVPAIANLIGVKMMGPTAEDLRNATEYVEEQMPKFIGHEDLLRDSFSLSCDM